MSQPYVGEIRLFAGNFAPAGWLFCEGQLLAISENDVLFSLIGTTYGGDGQNTFALPDLRGRVPAHNGSGFTLAQSGGVEQVTLTQGQIPAHTHALLATTSIASDTNPAGRIPAQASTFDPYQTASANSAMAPQSISGTGGSQPHNNFQPYLCLNFIISLFGIYPSQN
jgi:microcystin-dependent protein